MDVTSTRRTRLATAVHVSDVLAFYLLAALGSAVIVYLFVFHLDAERDTMTTVADGGIIVAAVAAIPCTRRFFRSHKTDPARRHMPHIEEWWLVPVVSATFSGMIATGLLVVGALAYLALYGVGSLVT